MSEITLPHDYAETVTSVSKWLSVIDQWHETHRPPANDAYRRVWYRGHDDSTYSLHPGVYRSDFTRQAEGFYGTGIEMKRLNLERELLAEFRVSGATLVNASAVEELYFVAQHYGMRTRLLDWTTNPLAGLYFACCKKMNKDGEVFIMDANALLASPFRKTPRSVITQRHPFSVDAIGESFWHDPKRSDWQRIIYPLRPDNRAGRVSQQSSCFTMHMHLSKNQVNKTLSRYKIPAKRKDPIVQELRRLNITEFSIFNDLDNLSKTILRAKLLWHAD